MKRLWFAVIFLLICAALCIAEQYYINNFYNEMNEKIDTALVFEKKDDERLTDAVNDIQEYLNENNDLIFMLTNHVVLNELSTAVRSVNAAGTEDDLMLIRSWLKVFYENQKITLSNIF